MSSSDKSVAETKRLNDDLEKRLYEFVSNCDDGKGDASACHSYGEWLAVVDKKYGEAAAVYKKNCDTKNYAASCFNYGRLLIAGKGVEMDDFQAKAALEKACNGGHIHGCHHLGLMYLNALGGEKDISKGIEAIDKACAAGEGGSCFRLGSMYLTSQSKYGLSRDVVKAKAYLELSCDANYAPACHNLAVMYKTGDAGVPKDDDLFHKYSLKTKALAEQNSGGVAGGLKVA
ncbi:hypothetical protein H257_12764 [Aphanomyces astaci]|uniref:Beta-lactamase n=1 Tax=Aphanomyces astaci TaxID=112090 RepID=W4FZ23_APHAT|nr:hypothetical protein H257_12764 [Aphanomyces astaci]ETV71933.1 hypothetical protein H257_12764 [Aphanomyces astaci]|eukprot:XP_009838376.1 hypothetical protein H257_12764 [Aphanomyces astaci]